MTPNKKTKGNPRAIVFLIITVFTFLLGCSDPPCDGDCPEQLPIAKFSADVQSIGLGGTINFTDMSENNPTAWQWTFEGGTPSTSTEKNPIVTYESLGSFSVILNVSNTDGNDTETKNAYITVSCETCSLECPDECRNQSINVNGVTRFYNVSLPTAYNSTENMPVIIDLHGAMSTKELQESFSAFEDIANANNIIMVWPEALDLTKCNGETVDNRWNANFVESPNDIGFIDALIDKLIADYKVNPKRIYVDGLSNGGFMAYSLACALSDKIAAIASVAGSMSDNLLGTCNPSRAMPVLEIHGTADQICNYDGYDAGCEGHAAAVEDVIAFWRSQGNCNTTFDEISYDDVDTTDGCTARMLTYQGCTTDQMVKLLIVDGGGHFWPGSEGFRDFYTENAPQYLTYLKPWNFDIEASQIIWDFFKEHSLP